MIYIFSGFLGATLAFLDISLNAGEIFGLIIVAAFFAVGNYLSKA